MSIIQKKQKYTSIHYKFPNDLIDHDALMIIRKLHKFGYLAYLVGGCVRDLLLGYQAKDFDIVTSARPREIKQIFKNARIIGKRFQLVHIQMSAADPIEVATFRQTPHPDALQGDLIVDDNEFGTASTDAHRRDFTINALFYDPIRHKIYDYCDGLEDIHSKQLRSIGDSMTRFREDPIRMLRAIKFSARLQLKFDKNLQDALVSEPSEIQKVAAPRLLQELVRMLQGGASVDSYLLLLKYQLLHLLAPELVASFQTDTAIQKRTFLLLKRLDEYRHQHIWNEASLLAILFLPMIQKLYEPYESHAQQHLVLRRLLAPFATRVGMPFKILRQMTHVLSVQLEFDRVQLNVFKRMINLDSLHILHLRSLDDAHIATHIKVIHKQIDEYVQKQHESHHYGKPYKKRKKRNTRKYHSKQKKHDKKNL